MKKLAALLLALTLTLGLVGCGNSAVGDVSGSTPPAAPSSGNQGGGETPTGGTDSSEPIKIALTAPLTGNLSQYGESFQNSVELACKQWNDKGGVLGRTVELVVEDTAGDSAQAATVA